MMSDQFYNQAEERNSTDGLLSYFCATQKPLYAPGKRNPDGARSDIFSFAAVLDNFR